MSNTILIIFMVLAALATLSVLARGIWIMARGKDITGVQSNKMMSYRVAFQALAIVFIIILFLINRPGLRRWSSSTASTPAPATTAQQGWSTARGGRRPMRCCMSSAPSTRRTPPSAWRACKRHRRRRALLAAIQNDLFDLGADLATPGHIAKARCASCPNRWRGSKPRSTRRTNSWRRSPRSSCPPGTPAATALHLARTIVRRAERDGVAAIAAGEALSPAAMNYLNRLSDHLFVLTRVENAATGDVLWVPGANR